MKRIAVVLMCALFSLSACTHKSAANSVTEGNMRTYSQMSDGTWTCDGHTYKHRLEVSGRMPGAAKDSAFVYLSNIEEISFRQAFMAAGFSSNSEDYFPPEEAVLVEME